MIQKQLTPVFLAMPSQRFLKYCVTNLRHDVSRGLVVHALDAIYCLLGFMY